jgi:hypothetical protein
MTRAEVIEFMKETLMELDGAGLIITDQDDVEKTLEFMSDGGFFKDIEEDEDDEYLEDFISEDFTDYQ